MDKDMDSSVRAVEKLLGYIFKNKKRLEEALTHPSYIDSASYQRLVFFGYAVLDVAISKYFFSYPEISPGQLTDLRRFNLINERLARVAVRHGLYRYVRRGNLADLDDKVRDFTVAVQQEEDDTTVYGGAAKAPKILADIVKSLAAAVYVDCVESVDCEFDLNTLWKNFKDFLEPMVTLDVLQQQPQPVNQKEKAKLEASSFSYMDMDMDSSVRAVEKLLCYRFKNKKLLEVALTHSSYIDSASYERLEFSGDAVLGLAISKYLFFRYPKIDPGQLTDLRRINIRNERLARVAVRHGLYSYVRRRNVPVLDDKVRDFTEAVQQEDDTKVDGGDVKARKILADIVESLAAAVFVDCEFDLDTLWRIFKDFLEPMVTLDVLQQQPQPVNQKEKTKFHAAKVAEQKLCPKPSYRWLTDQYNPPREEPNVIHEAQVGWRSTMLMIASCGCNVILYCTLFFLLFVIFIGIVPE